MKLQQVYPSYHFDINNIDLWIKEFEGEDYQSTALVVKDIINTSKFFPTIADIKNKLHFSKNVKKFDNFSETIGKFEIENALKTFEQNKIKYIKENGGLY